MTDLLTKVKAALEGATQGPWGLISDTDDDWGLWTVHNAKNPLDHVCDVADQHNALLIALAPDMARALIAAVELAAVCDELMGLFPDQRLHLEKALATFRAAMEGRVDG